ncbi:MAG: UDP-3-O-acyl-N-acetylglucosamine deacetylase [Candidatus Omnitrophica bacterium]|nr:UDP-3-O-acyl-N-acetylglucosamine deacetylase [Candidatus Omnitrophota bacterium]MDD5080413.1 UDP-3-O-acyl-N-acetylglucosamine deacetylase [Candidatus Omnitrophota bacterium]MDD5441093.1 UDP-3-O-acyl-N-acetylglucosamine deacetylase [Candidatus Omnitrophota bacterium]
MQKQKTIKDKVIFEGVGLHTGKKTKMEVLPAPANTGIIFVRKDLDDSPLIKADALSILNPIKYPRRTSIGTDTVHVFTIEHFLAVAHIMGIDNLQINIWDEEVPGFDGSAKDLFERISAAGLCEQDAARDVTVVKEPIWVDKGNASITLLPYDGFKITYVMSYDHEFIGTQFIEIDLEEAEKTRLYEARTFCLEEEAKLLIEKGMGKGSSYDTTLVIGKGGVVNNKLRFIDEPVRHKVLDMLGDLYLAGNIKGHIIAVKSGHSLNIELVEKIFRLKESAKRMQGASLAADAVINNSEVLDVRQIMNILPHRYPFLLVDRVTNIEPGNKIVGIKNVSMNEHFFQGHFPGRPVMPGVLIVEAMAQLGGVLILGSAEHRGKLAFFMAANDVKFRKTVVPGDQLVMEITIGKIRSRTGSVHAKAYVDGKVATEGELMFAIVEN